MVASRSSLRCAFASLLTVVYPASTCCAWARVSGGPAGAALAVPFPVPLAPVPLAPVRGVAAGAAGRRAPGPACPPGCPLVSRTADAPTAAPATTTTVGISQRRERQRRPPPRS